MKKVFYLIIGIMLLVPIKVKADMAAPAVRSYEAIVINDNAKVYKDVNKNDKFEMIEIGSLKKNQKIEVYYEYLFDKITYGQIEYNYEVAYIKLSDLVTASDTFDISKASVTNEAKVYVYGDDVYLYKGPSKAYSKVSNNSIPKGTVLTYNLTDAQFEYEDNPSESLWAYTTYNGQSGWIYKYQNEDLYYNGVSGVADIPTKDEDTSILTIKNITELKEIPSKNSKKIKSSIPKNTKLNYLLNSCSFMQENFGGGYVYVKFNGASGWLELEEDALLKKTNERLLVIDDVKLYDSFNDEDSITDINVPLDSELSYDYNKRVFLENDINADWFYVTYNNKNYWLKANIAIDDYEDISYQNIALSDIEKYNGLFLLDDTSFYGHNNLTNKVATIPKYTKLKSEYYTYIKDSEGNFETLNYVEYNNQKGWIIKDYEKIAMTNDTSILNTTSINIYEDANTSSRVVGNLPANTEIIEVYDTYSSWYYIKYNNIEGWINHDNVVISNFSEKYQAKNSIKVYSDISLNNLAFTIPKDAIFTKKFDKNKNIYITYNNKSGWIKDDENEFKMYYEPLEYDLTKLNINENPIKTPSEESHDKPNNKDNKLAPKEIITYSIALASALSFIALTIILIVNKKRK